MYEDPDAGGDYLVRVGLQLSLYVAELTAENEPAQYMSQPSRVRLATQMMGIRTHEDKGDGETFMFPQSMAAKLVGFLVVDGEEVCFSLNGSRGCLGADSRLRCQVIGALVAIRRG